MDVIKAILLGLVQGLTEFLPISSSGHLVIGSEILNFHHPGITFEVFLHLGTLLAVLVAFRSELRLMIRSLFVSAAARQADPELNRFFLWNIYIVVATLPAVAVGLLLKDSIDRIFDDILVSFVMLAVSGTIMVLTKWLRDKGAALSCSKSLIIGVAQSMAIMPGLSRSGSTIFTGMLLGVNRETAARFSFIMSIPAILGAVVLKSSDLLTSPPSATELTSLFAGTIASAISGYAAIVLLMHVVRRGKLHWFGYYCFFVSTLGLTWYFLER